MRVFIDANIFLGAYGNSNDGLKRFEKFNEALTAKSSKLQIILPQITFDEFLRNTDSVVGVYLKQLDNSLSGVNMGLNKDLCGEEMVVEFNQKRNELKEAFEKIRSQYIANIDLLRNLVIELRKISCTQSFDENFYFNRAFRRYWLGNPPGKSDRRIGDELAWEIMIDRFTDDDLCVISADEDWAGKEWLTSNGKKRVIKKQLLIEWEKKTSKKLVLYQTLSSFIKDQKINNEVTIEQITDEEMNNKFISDLSLTIDAGFLDSINKISALTSPSVAHLHSVLSNSILPNMGSLIQRDDALSNLLQTVKSLESLTPSFNPLANFDYQKKTIVKENNKDIRAEKKVVSNAVENNKSTAEANRAPAKAKK